MKRVIASYIERQYGVAVYPRGSRGSVSDKMIQHWALSSTSLERCKDFAIDILAGMSLNEIFDDMLTGSSKKDRYITLIQNKYGITLDEPIGYDVAEKEFSFDIYREG